MNYTVIIVAITVLVSIAGFTNEQLQNKLILWPRYMDNPGQYYRLLTSGFIHADWMHLAFNMFSFYSFGEATVLIFQMLGKPPELFLIVYLSAIVVSSLPSFLKHRNDGYYRSLGASGGVAAILFFFTFYFPWQGIKLFFFPEIPAVVFGALYLGFEFYASRRGIGNVNHDAHFWGAVYGLFVAFLVDPSHGKEFLNTITHPSFHG